MEIPKDMYEYLANFADDRTILNMLSVNKKFSDPVFFERIFKRKYPLLIEFKKEDETIKEFYLRMTKYIYKIEEEFGVPYFPIEYYDPKDYYRKLKNERKPYNKILIDATKAGEKDIVKLMLEKGVNPSYGMYMASQEGYIDIVKLLIEKGSLDFSSGLIAASSRGYIDIVKLLIEKIIEKDTIDKDIIDYAIKLAEKNKKTEVVNYLKNIENNKINS